MTPNDISLHFSISALSIHPQKDFLWQLMATEAETPSQTLCRERESKWKLPVKFSPLEFRESGGRGHTKSMRAIMVGGHPENKAL